MSVSLDACLSNIIGLSRTECDCFTDNMPTDASVSESGLMLDELEGLNLNMLRSDDCSGLWDMLEQAKREAITQTRIDLLSCIASNANLRRRPFNGVAGEWYEAKNILNKKTYAAMRMRFAPNSGGFARIKRIGAKFDTTGTIDLHLYSIHESSPIATVTINTEAGKLVWNDFPFFISDLSIQSGLSPEYFLVYQSPFKPYNTVSSCGCGIMKPVWDEAAPCYNRLHQSSEYGWSAYMMIGGGTGDSLTNMAEWRYTKELYGLVLDIELGCDTRQTLCKDSLNYESDPYAITLANAVRYKAGEYLMMKIRSKPNPNYYTLVIPDMLPELQDRYKSEYDNRIFNYLCPELSSHQNINRFADCYVCKDPYGFVLNAIRK